MVRDICKQASVYHINFNFNDKARGCQNIYSQTAWTGTKMVVKVDDENEIWIVLLIEQLIHLWELWESQFFIISTNLYSAKGAI